MKRRIVAALLIATMPLGMAACLQIKPDNPTSSPSSSSAPSQEATSTPTQASPSASSSSKSSQTKEEACAILDNKANEISSSLNDKEKESVIKTLSSFIDIMKSDEITNPEVKEAANGLADSAQKLLDATKAADEPPTADQRSKILTATSAYLESMRVAPRGHPHLSMPTRGHTQSDGARQRALHTVSSDDIDVVNVVYRSMASLIWSADGSSPTVLAKSARA